MLGIATKQNQVPSAISLRPHLHSFKNQDSSQSSIPQDQRSSFSGRKEGMKIGRILLTSNSKTEMNLRKSQTISSRKDKLNKYSKYPTPGLYRVSSGTVLVGEHTGMRGRKYKRCLNGFNTLQRDQFLNFFNRKPRDNCEVYKKQNKQLKKKLILGLNLPNCCLIEQTGKQEKPKLQKKIIVTLNKRPQEGLPASRTAAVYQSLNPKATEKDPEADKQNSRDKGVCWRDEETPWSMQESLPFESIKIVPPSESDFNGSPSSLLSISIRQSTSLLQVPSSSRKRKLEPATFPLESSFFSSGGQYSSSSFKEDSPAFILDQLQPLIIVTEVSFSAQKIQDIIDSYLERVFSEIESIFVSAAVKKEKSDLATYIQNSTCLDKSLIIISADLPFNPIESNKQAVEEKRSLQPQQQILKDISVSRSTANGSSSFGFSKIKEKLKQSHLLPVRQSYEEESEVIIDNYYEQSEDILSSIPRIDTLQSRIGIKQNHERLSSRKKVHIAEMELQMSELGCSMESYCCSIREPF